MAFMSEPSTVRLAVIGGMRGESFGRVVGHLGERLHLSAIVDPDPEVCFRWQQAYAEIHAFSDLDACLTAGVCDAVLIATPMALHARQSIQAMNAGKHVLCEVPACISHAEALELIETCERTRVVFMMGENLNYMRPQMMVLNMVRKGALGDLSYAEGAYLHDCRDLYFNPDGTLTWRGRIHGTEPAGGNTYPTHPFGPIAWWLGIGESDQIASIYSLTSTGRGNAAYATHRFGPDHPGAMLDYWRRGDSTSCLIKTRLGRVIQIRSDMSCARPIDNKAFELQGTLGCVRSNIDRSKPPVCWLASAAERSNEAQSVSASADEQERKWTGLYQHADEFEHPLWREHMQAALDCGHDGSDFFVLKEFLDTVQQRIANPIDVYSAVTWSSLVWLTGDSERLQTAVPAIDYRRRPITRSVGEHG